jgi:UDP-3-O-[3-hydroxymyristoyl] glucosamine N-acyltransferase
MMDLTVDEIAQLVGGTVDGDGSVRITGVNGLREAERGDLVFVRGKRYLPYLAETRASAVLISERPEGGLLIPLILTPHPDLAFAQVIQQHALPVPRHPQGIHESAVVGARTILGEGVALAAHVYVGEDCVIGSRVVLYPGVYIGNGVNIGDDTIVYPNVIVREDTEIGSCCILHAGACIGSDGFGFAPLGGRWEKIPQIGRVILGDDVEVGTNTAIDRATFGVTRIGRGTKIDNLVQIGHNVEIGEHCIIAGKVGIAGSAMIGHQVRIGASAGINGHIEIGDGASIGARAGVTKSVGPGETVSGFPAMDHTLARRVLVAQQRLPELMQRIRELERQVTGLRDRLHEQTKDHC